MLRGNQYRLMLRNWEPRGDGWIVPGRRGAMPGPWIVFEPPVSGHFRCGIELEAEGLDVLRLRCRVRGPAGIHWQDIFVDMANPGALLHQLDRVELEVMDGPAHVHLVLEGVLEPGEALLTLSLEPSSGRLDVAEELPGRALRITKLDIPRVDAQAAASRSPFAAARPEEAPAPDKRTRGRRDAVVFAWWIPDTKEARRVGEYYLGLLRYHHPDSRIFLGVNHGSHPEPLAAVVNSGLDVQVCHVPPEIDVNSDVGGFLAALEAFHQSPEQFDLVWFGHTKGASRPDTLEYRQVRFFQDRFFWSRRAEIERAFQDPAIGLMTARYNLSPTYPFSGPWKGWVDELAALQRIYRDRYPPLGLNALDTFYVLRGEIVRAFCDAVAPWFFHTDPGVYGASRWFFEMAFPSIASMQGYEPFIDMDVPGDNDPRDDIMLDHDIKQTQRLARQEVLRWREDPPGFRPRVLPWDRPWWKTQI